MPAQCPHSARDSARLENKNSARGSLIFKGKAEASIPSKDLKNRGHCFIFQAGTVAGTVRALRGHCAGTVYSLGAAFPTSFHFESRLHCWASLLSANASSDVAAVSIDAWRCYGALQALASRQYSGARKKGARLALSEPTLRQLDSIACFVLRSLFCSLCD